MLHKLAGSAKALIVNRSSLCILCLVVAFRMPCLLVGQTVDVRKMEISSHWRGLGKPQTSEIVVVKEGATFRLGHSMVPTERISRFVSALIEPDLVEPNLTNLGITTEWLTANHDGPSLHYQGGPEIGAANQRALYQKNFEDPAFISGLLSSVYKSGFHTDDYPSVRVTLAFADGTSASVSSNSQQPFMLPWKIEFHGLSRVTYTADISRTLAAIMPEKTANRSRIMGDDLLEIIKERADQALEPQINFLDAENRAGPTLTEIKKKYSIVEAEINGYHHPEYGTEWSGNQSHETNLHALLSRPDLPPKVYEALVLKFAGNKVEGADEFLTSIGKYETLFLSVPWLSKYVLRNNNAPIRISYVHTSSFGDKALRVFTADMTAVGKDHLAQEVRSKQKDIVLLMAGMEYAEAYWLILPDKAMVLWRYGGPSGLLKWKPADFPANECADYGIPFGGCVGAKVDFDGNIVRN